VRHSAALRASHCQRACNWFAAAFWVLLLCLLPVVVAAAVIVIFYAILCFALAGNAI